jgi:hypothetical protein
MKIKLFEEYSGNYDFVTFGNFDNKPLPKTDEDIKKDRELSWKAINVYDEIFGTNVKETYGEDYGLLLKDPSIKYPTSGDVIKKLIENSYTSNWYAKFNIQNNSSNIPGMILDQIMNSLQGKEVTWKNLKKYLKNELTISQRKKEFIYNLYLNFGSEFDQDITREVFDIKGKNHKFEIKEEIEVEKMEKSLEKLWWRCIKWSLNHYKDYFKLDDMIDRACDKLISMLDNKTEYIDKWVDVKVEEFKNKLK